MYSKLKINFLKLFQNILCNTVNLRTKIFLKINTIKFDNAIKIMINSTASGEKTLLIVGCTIKITIYEK